MKYRYLWLYSFMSFLLVGSVSAQTAIRDLLDVIESGDVVLEQSEGTGASSGSSVDGVLENSTNREMNIEVYLSKPIYLKNSGSGQNMIATQVYGRDGSYFSDGKKSFISLKPKSSSRITFIAYCADFGKDNPTASERFVIAETPPSLAKVMGNITNFSKQNPNKDITVAAQVAVWLAQGQTASEIKKKFNFTPQDEKLAREFLK